MDHHLSPLLAPRSIAIVGASPKSGTVQRNTIEVLKRTGYSGTLYGVNPNYEEVLGLPCVPNVASLPSPPDLALIVVGAHHIEAVVDSAIAGGARSLLIFDNCYLENDTTPKLLDRLKAKVREAGIPVCGGNGLGYFNFEQGIFVSHYHPPSKPTGKIAFIAHSGSVFDGFLLNDHRFRFNFAISPGQEINASVGDYMDFALELPSTRVIALFIEAVRDPDSFIAALKRAQEKDVAVVAVKVGRTEKSARFAQTHTGALVGSDTGFDAVLDRYGAVRVKNCDELFATASLLSMSKRPGPGAFSAVIDSGGLRASLIDLATEHGVSLAELESKTTEYLADVLPPYLLPENPLDVGVPWSWDRPALVRNIWGKLLADKETAIGGYQFEVFDDFCYEPDLMNVAEEIAEMSSKPFFLFNSFHCAKNEKTATDFADKGIPLINGEENVLAAVRAVFTYRDLRARENMRLPPAADATVTSRWRERLRDKRLLDEKEGLEMLAEHGIRSVSCRIAANLDEAIEAAQSLEYPVAMKTAESGILHKSDRGGVHLNLKDGVSVERVYNSLKSEIGPRVIVEAMAVPGIELALGALMDPQYGPLIMIGMGGILVEVLADTAVALAPFDEREAMKLLDRLKGRPLLEGARGGPKADISSLARMLANFSVLVASLGNDLQSLDVNPVIVSPSGAVAVDALVIGEKNQS